MTTLTCPHCGDPLSTGHATRCAECDALLCGEGACNARHAAACGYRPRSLGGRLGRVGPLDPRRRLGIAIDEWGRYEGDRDGSAAVD